MATYLNEINRARRKAGDIRLKARDTQTGNGVDTIFQLANKPIVNGGWTVSVGGVAKTVSADYNIDCDSGILRVMSAPTSAETVLVEYEHAEANDLQWQQWYNEGIRKMDGKFGTYNVATSAGTGTSAVALQTVTNQVEYSTSGIVPELGDILGVEFQYTSGDQRSWKTIYNWKWFNDTLYLAHEYGNGYPLRISYLGKYPSYETTSATVSVQDKFVDIPLYYSIASFMEYKLARRLDYAELPSVERGQAVASSVQNAAQYWWKKFQEEYNRKRPNRGAVYMGGVTNKLF